MNAHPFHEWPLVVFTTLAVMGAGLLTAPLVAAIVGPSAAAASPVLPAGTALLAAGLLVSLAHLGQPQRSALALARVGRSRLSNEILFASAALGAGALAVLFPYRSPVTTLLPSVCAVAFMISLGLVYALPGQLAWRGTVAVSPLTLGVGFGTLGLAAAWDGAVTDIAPVAAIALSADVGLLVWRRRALQMWRNAPALTSSRPWRFAPHLLSARFLLVDVLPGCLLVAGLPKGAAGLLGLGILVDRLSFYLLAVQHTTETEIARIEGVMSHGGAEQ
jgi:DMSO reductase anchor subunit